MDIKQLNLVHTLRYVLTLVYWQCPGDETHVLKQMKDTTLDMKRQTFQKFVIQIAIQLGDG